MAEPININVLRPAPIDSFDILRLIMAKQRKLKAQFMTL